jgi:hypothetical protein
MRRLGTTFVLSVNFIYPLSIDESAASEHDFGRLLSEE